MQGTHEDSPHHSVLAKPWTYAIVGLSFQRDLSDRSASTLELVLQRQSELVRLRFVGVHELEIESSFPGITSGLQILDVSARGMEDARVRVCSFEQDSPIRFWARSVERVTADGGVGSTSRAQTATLQSFARPSAAIPLLMSLVALALVLAHVALVGPGREPDEGAAAHVFQLLIVAQVPIAAFFAFRWFRHNRTAALRVLAAQAAAVAVALFPVWYFGL